MAVICKIKIPIDVSLANPNRIGSLHWTRQRKIKGKLKLVARSYWNQAGRPVANSPVNVQVTIRRARSLDNDNAIASLKPFIDGLFKKGITPDDSAKWVRLLIPIQETGEIFNGMESVEFLVTSR
jgi:hypothetical protein